MRCLVSTALHRRDCFVLTGGFMILGTSRRMLDGYGVGAGCPCRFAWLAQDRRRGPINQGGWVCATPFRFAQAAFSAAVVGHAGSCGLARLL